ncbi:MAG: GNAT family N-acetyltransferase [Mariprofundaceae bacterium]
MITDSIHPTPWDTRIFGTNCYEITDFSESVLAYTSKTSGHYTIKVDPLANKDLLHRHGFYYTDTLIEPVCRQDQLVIHNNPDCTINTNARLDDILPICSNCFLHGRFHRDFNLPKSTADRRYMQWLVQLHDNNDVYGLYYRNALAGFIAHDNDNLLLHAIGSHFRGKGLAKFFWSAVCNQLFQEGSKEIRSSISAANLPILNLYASLGFRFNHAVDVYHKLNK